MNEAVGPEIRNPKAEGNPNAEIRNGKEAGGVATRASAPEKAKGKPQAEGARRGVRFRLLYMGDSRWRRA